MYLNLWVFLIIFTWYSEKLITNIKGDLCQWLEREGVSLPSSVLNIWNDLS